MGRAMLVASMNDVRDVMPSRVVHLAQIDPTLKSAYIEQQSKIPRARLTASGISYQRLG